eukprot:Skav227226  [mRNA]  locus=scaffold2048:531232:534006:- [translate_table: standard]
MQDHLRNVHATPIFEWNPARDCLAGNVCRHCEARFTSTPGVRNHIIYGRCDFFDPHADCSTLPLDPVIAQVLAEGCALEHLQDPEDRLRWTVQCMNCGQAYKRSNDPSAHILQCHADLWHQAQPLVQLLRDAWYRVHGCLCSPAIQYPRAQHICLLLVQMAMHHLRSKAPLLVPYVFTEDDLQSLQMEWAPEFLKTLWEILQQRNFSALWTDPQLVAALSRTCFFCGRHTLSSGELLVHLIQHHQAQHVGHVHYVPQLVHNLQNEMAVDFQCYACDAIFNVPSHEDTDPTRQLLVQNHLKFQCPVVQQLSYILSGHGHFRTGDGTGGHGHSDEKCVQRTGASVQRRTSQHGGQTGKEAKTRKRRAETPAEEPAEPRSPHDRMPQDGISPDSSGTGVEQPEITRYFHSAHLPGSGRSPSTVGSAGRPMEEVASGGKSQVAIESPADSASIWRATSKTFSGSEGIAGPSTQQCLVDDLERQRVGDGGWSLALHEVGQGQKPDGPQSGQEAHSNGQDGSTPDRNPGSLAGPLQRAQVSGHESQSEHHRAVETSDLSEDRFADVPTDAVVRECSPDPGGRDHEGSSATIVKTGQGTATDDGHEQGCWQREEGQPTATSLAQMDVTLRMELQKKVLQLTLANPRNLCAANATIVAWLWATLQTEKPLSDLWGKQASAILKWLCDLPFGERVNLLQAPWLADLMAAWGSFEQQVDATEYVQMLIGEHAPAFRFSWDRRYEKGVQVVVDDAHTSFNPLTLQLPEGHLPSSLSLLQLLSVWQQVDGMCAALSAPPDILCINVTRFLDDEDGLPYKSNVKLHAPLLLSMPVFHEHSLEQDMIQYVILSMVVHLGEDTAGHYRAVTRFMDRTEGWKWAVYDDHRLPEYVTELPMWVEENVVLFFYCRCEMQRYAMPAASAAAPALDAKIMALLQ